MARTKWLDHGGKRVFLIDLSNTDIDGVKAAVAEGKAILHAQPLGSVLCVVDATATKFSLEISDVMKDFAMHNKPYMRMTAIVGVAGIASVVINTAIAFTKRDNLVVKDSMSKALDFLAAQP